MMMMIVIAVDWFFFQNGVGLVGFCSHMTIANDYNNDNHADADDDG